MRTFLNQGNHWSESWDRGDHSAIRPGAGSALGQREQPAFCGSGRSGAAAGWRLLRSGGLACLLLVAFYAESTRSAEPTAAPAPAGVGPAPASPAPAEPAVAADPRLPAVADAPVPAAAGGPHRFERVEPHMGTLFRIVVYAPSEAAATVAVTAAFARIAALNQVYSDYADDSELTLLNKRAGTGPVPVSAELFAILADAQAMAQQSGGAFDVTVGPLSRLWRRARKVRELPSADRLAEALALVGADKLQLDPDQRTVSLAVPGMRLDLGGIAKGDACAAALAVLAEHGLRSALVVGGGEVSVSAPPPGETGWPIEIDAPAPDRPQRLLLAHAAVAQSGDLYQFVEIDGVRHSHLINPATGLALTDRRRVTVVAPGGRQADALASALSVMPIPDGLALADRLPAVAAQIVQVVDAGDHHPPPTASQPADHAAAGTSGLRKYHSCRWRDLKFTEGEAKP